MSTGSFWLVGDLFLYIHSECLGFLKRSIEYILKLLLIYFQYVNAVSRTVYLVDPAASSTEEADSKEASPCSSCPCIPIQIPLHVHPMTYLQTRAQTITQINYINEITEVIKFM